MPKTRKYPCCIRIERESVRKNRQTELILFIKGRHVEANQTQIAVLNCLHKNQGHLVSYKQLNLILGHKSTRPPQLHILRQYVSWIGKTLTAHNALCMLAVAPRIGYVLCGHK